MKRRPSNQLVLDLGLPVPKPKKRPRPVKLQDDLSKMRRLMGCRCPTHGTFLSQGTSPEWDGTGWIGECPRKDCNFSYWAKEGGRVFLAWERILNEASKGKAHGR